MRKNIFVFAILMALACTAPSVLGAEKSDLPLTTSSAEARSLYRDGQTALKNYNFNAARSDFRKAADLDPSFSLAHIELSFLAPNATEQFAELKKAVANKAQATPGEQLVVEWLDNAIHGKMIPAIQALNDILAQYPEDLNLSWQGAFWLAYRGVCESAIPIYERVISQDKTFAAAWHGAGECYIREGSVSKGLAAIKQTVVLLPKQPSIEIYYGETLARVGQYDKGIAHCKAGLGIDANAMEAWHCMAQAHAFKQDEARARDEYKRFLDAPGVNPNQHTTVALEWATTYVWQGDYKQADEAFAEVARQAHQAAQGQFEAEAYRAMALYNENANAGLELLRKAEHSLEEHTIAGLTLAAERARLLQTRELLALRLHDMDLAEATVKHLEQLAADAHLPAAERCYAGARGSLLVAQGKYQEAISFLQQDPDNALSMQQLVEAYRQTGAGKQSRATLDKLARNHSISVEQVLANKDLHKQKVQIASK